MSQYITIATFTYPSELVVIRARLEAEGIECIVKDELTAQVHNFYSNAIGGIKLQVAQRDKGKAEAILKENGYGAAAQTEQSAFWKKVHAKTRSISIVKNYTPEVRLLLIAAPVVFLLAMVGYFASIPSTNAYLTDNTWCLLYVTYNGETYAPETLVGPNTLYLENQGNWCGDHIDFLKDGGVELPGFNTPAISGRWDVSESGVRLSKLDTFQYILEGDYKVVRGNQNMELVSEHATIHCTKSW